MENKESDGNNQSNGNNRSSGNNYSNGNNCSNGNNHSFFLHKCNGTHKSMFCHNLNGIRFTLFNKNCNEEQYEELRRKVLKALNGWLPHTINFEEMKQKGWHKKHEKSNQFVSEFVENDKKPFVKQYHDAWSRIPFDKKQALFKVIEETSWLPSNKWEVLKEITGLERTGCVHDYSDCKFCPNCGIKLR